jgi:hypothetical protein
MGSFLSTRWNGTSTTRLTSQYPCIEARQYWQWRTLEPKRAYAVPDGSGRAQILRLQWTPCQYGGERPWWECPWCWRRCSTLYLRQSWGCRRCHRLTYWTQRHGKLDRLQHRARKVARKLGLRWHAEGPWGRVTRPKGMHRRTYERLLREWGVLQIAADMLREDELLRGMARWLPRLERR